MSRLTDQIDGVSGEAGVRDGRIRITAGSESTLYVSAPERQPLSRGQEHLRLRIVGDEFEASVSLDADQLLTLANALDVPTADFRVASKMDRDRKHGKTECDPDGS